ncbi:MAG: hypothetical protein M3019_11360 [Candidatus Dormibacteraeota bacterium]|nr:hypothetical protein [Candidatus Dormibacteraeota bacterium]
MTSGSPIDGATAVHNAKIALVAECHRTIQVLRSALSTSLQERLASVLQLLDEAVTRVLPTHERGRLEGLLSSLDKFAEETMPVRLITIATGLLRQAAAETAGLSLEGVDVTSSSEELLSLVSWVGSHFAQQTALILAQRRLGFEQTGIYQGTIEARWLESELLSSEPSLVREKEYAAAVAEAAREASRAGRRLRLADVAPMRDELPELTSLLA